MIIKKSVVVSHPGACAWGVGKVIEVGNMKATIQFSDGITRKIASSHYATLQPGDPDAFVATAEISLPEKAKTAPRKPRKLKVPVLLSDVTEM
jgi:hypothetical protein